MLGSYFLLSSSLLMRCFWLVTPAALLLFLSVVPLAAQQVELGFGLGYSAPRGPLAERRTAGPLARLSLGLGTDTGLGLRADLAWEHFPERALSHGIQRPPGHGGSLDVRSLRGSVVYTFPVDWASPYLLLGAGAYDLQIPEQWNPYGRVAGIHTGAGLRLGLGVVRAFAEVQGVVILSDHGNSDFELSRYLPVVVGVRF
jgi:hypothetical protein